MGKRIMPALAVIMAALSGFLCVCGRDGRNADEIIAHVGTVPLTRQDADVFAFVYRNFPGPRNDTFGFDRQGNAWALLAAEAIWQQESRNPAYERLRAGKEWQLKRQACLSQAFERRILQDNCGYSDAEVRNYFDAHRADFRDIIYSDTAAPCTTDAVPPFDSVRGEVARRLFLSTFRHDSGSLNLNDPRLFGMFRERLYRDYFLEKYFAEEYKKPLPDSIITLLGSDVVPDTIDVGIVLSWMPDAERDRYEKNPSLIIRRLLQLRLFCGKAAEKGYASGAEAKKVLAWAWKLEIVRQYVNDVLAPAARNAPGVDPVMARYSFLDEYGERAVSDGAAGLRDHIAGLALQKKTVFFDSLVYAIRRARGVRFRDPDAWSDGRIKAPAALLREADSLRDGDAVPQAQALYGVLSEYYPFTGEGITALFEQAKILTDQPGQGRSDAVKNLRRFLLFAGADDERRCEAGYRIAFIEDQYLARKEFAALNYRWVIENNPGCSFAGDAEVMLRHLANDLPGAGTLGAGARVHKR